MSKKLVAYFSVSGTTARVAKELAKQTGADLYEIRPAVPYTKEDVDWSNPNSRSTLEMKNRSYRPPLADHDANVEHYDLVFLGFPIWWYVAPTIINTFLESYDFAGKTIILFATSGGSHFGGTVRRLQPSLPVTAVLKEGRILNARRPAKEIRNWIRSFGL